MGDDIDLDSLAGMVISGGDDIDPALYGEAPQAEGRYDRDRDTMESRCIDFALGAGLPLLGICRGHQLINTVMGGSLYISVRSLRVRTSNSWSLLPKKRVSMVKTCRLANIFGKSHILVNSLHNQAIAEVADQLSAVAFDGDHIIQAIEAADGRAILGVQWHPEYLCFLPAQLRLFRWLTRQAKSRDSLGA